MKRDLSGLPLVCAIWDDAHGRATGEYTADEVARDFHKSAAIQTFGLLVHQDERGISLASEMTAEAGETEFKSYRGLSFIPRAMLRDLVVLGVPKRPATRKKGRPVDA